MSMTREKWECCEELGKAVDEKKVSYHKKPGWISCGEYPGGLVDCPFCHKKLYDPYIRPSPRHNFEDDPC